MDFNNYSFGKIDYKKLFKTGSLVIGGILLFISIFIPYPIFIYTASIGALLIIIHLILKVTDYFKQKPLSFKTNKNRVQITKRCDDNKVIAICPYCKQKIRLTYNKGKHSVKCPKCQCKFEVKNKWQYKKRVKVVLN